jgi:hypothetical protein
MKGLVLVVLLVFTGWAAHAAEQGVLFREDFADLANWKPLYFPKIEKHTVYSIESKGAERYLKAESKGSASALVYKREFNVNEYPHIRWRWKVENIYKSGDVHTKKGDDYPIRVYVLFKYNPEQAGFLDKLKYNTVKPIYGEYPPHSSLNYIWASKPTRRRSSPVHTPSNQR